MFGISALIRRGRDSSRSLPLPLPTVSEYSKKAPEGGPSPDTESARTLILDFPASRTMRNRLLLFKPPVYSILL